MGEGVQDCGADGEVEGAEDAGAEGAVGGYDAVEVARTCVSEYIGNRMGDGNGTHSTVSVLRGK